jgi:hypothetical protein
VDALSQEDLGRTVRNKTGLAGNYDFTLQWTPEARKGPAEGRQTKFSNYSEFFNALPKSNRSTGAEVRVPDSSGPSIFLAIQEQLGLKLEPQTTPLEFLVIDHAEKPAEKLGATNAIERPAWVALPKLLRFRKLQDHPAALPSLHRRQLTVPFFDQRAAVFDPPQFQQLRRQRILPDAVGIRFSLRAGHQ